jgi:AcrR family transcriptional regulator
MVYQTEETRENILAIAEKLFNRNGLFETQMTDVADAAGVSRTTLYRYFQDKLDLSMEILDRVVNDLECRAPRDYLTAGACGIERLEAYLRSRWLSTKFNRHLRFFAEFDAYFSGPRLRVEFKGKLDRVLRDHPLDDLRWIVEEGMRDGSIRQDIDAELATVTIFNAVRGLYQRILLRGKVLVEVKRKHLGEMTKEHIRYLIDGLRPRDGSNSRNEAGRSLGQSAS